MIFYDNIAKKQLKTIEFNQIRLNFDKNKNNILEKSYDKIFKSRQFVG